MDAKNDETPKAGTNEVSDLSATTKELTMTSIATQISTINVPFYGQSVPTIYHDGQPFIAMRPIVENIGIDWTGQSVKLRNQKEKFNCRDISMVAADGKIRRLLCLPLKKLNGWLFSINPEKVRIDIRDKLIQYQEECFSVLHEYWTKGEVKKKSRQSTATQLIPLRQTAERLITTGLGKLYPDIWKLVHKKFDIEHINQLQPDQVGEAVEYLNVLEGEFIAKGEDGNKPVSSKAESRYRVRVIIYDNLFGGCVEMLGIGDTFKSIANGIATDLGYRPSEFTHVGINKEKLKRVY